MIAPWAGVMGVQRSGRTSIRATTRSFSTSVNFTPFNSANGIVIALTLSSSDMVRQSFRFLQGTSDTRDRAADPSIPIEAWTAHVSQAMTSEVMAAVTMPC
jgi:hypothetical protein